MYIDGNPLLNFYYTKKKNPPIFWQENNKDF